MPAGVFTRWLALAKAGAFLLKSGMQEGIVTSNFKPAWWLKNRHAQTIYPSLPLSGAPKCTLRRENLELPDGDITVVHWMASGPTPESGAPTLIILHGLEGSSESSYARMLLQAAIARGWRAAVLHFRDCGDYRNRLPRRYHAGETNDIRFFLDSLRSESNNGPLIAAGFSLGGSVLLKYLGESGLFTPLDAAVAVSVPLSLHDSSDALSCGFSKFYNLFLLNKMKMAVRRKFNRHTAAFDWPRTMAARTFAEFDDAVTAPLHGFSGKDEYYDRCSAIGYLGDIRIPTLIVNSLDDPFMTPAAIPAPSGLSDYVQLEVTTHGGHIGFIAGGTPWRPRYYLPERIIGFLHASLKDTGTHGLALPSL